MKAPAIYRALCENTTDLGSLAGNKHSQTTHAHTATQNCAHYAYVEKERLHAYTKQCTESYVHIYMWILLLQIIIQIKVLTETEEICWVMERNVCAEDYTF